MHSYNIQGSWVKKIMDRVYNVEKSRKRKCDDCEDSGPPKKRGRPKRLINLETRYPKMCAQDEDAGGHPNEEALRKEMEKEKPRKDIVLQLMKGTFYTRRQYILNSEGSVVSKLAKYPGLRMSTVV